MRIAELLQTRVWCVRAFFPLTLSLCSHFGEFEFSRVVHSAFDQTMEPFYTIENLIMCTCTKIKFIYVQVYGEKGKKKTTAKGIFIYYYIAA